MVPSECFPCLSSVKPSSARGANAADPAQIWEYFLAYSTIASRQGTASCYQIVLVKNINSTHRVEGIPTQFGLSGALSTSDVDMQAWVKNETVNFPAVATH